MLFYCCINFISSNTVVNSCQNMFNQGWYVTLVAKHDYYITIQRMQIMSQKRKQQGRANGHIVVSTVAMVKEKNIIGQLALPKTSKTNNPPRPFSVPRIFCTFCHIGSAVRRKRCYGQHCPGNGWLHENMVVMIDSYCCMWCYII